MCRARWAISTSERRKSVLSSTGAGRQIIESKFPSGMGIEIA